METKQVSEEQKQAIVNAQKRYVKAMHSVQTAITMHISSASIVDAGADPKHLRTGINGNFVQGAALAELLLSKGVFTLVEYYEMMAEKAEEEAATVGATVRKALMLPDTVEFK